MDQQVALQNEFREQLRAQAEQFRQNLADQKVALQREFTQKLNAQKNQSTKN
jgi:hypothetical protein